MKIAFVDGRSLLVMSGREIFHEASWVVGSTWPPRDDPDEFVTAPIATARLSISGHAATLAVLWEAP